MNRTLIVSLALACAITFGLYQLGNSHPEAKSQRHAAVAVSTAEPLDVVVSAVPGDDATFDVIVGHHIHVEEGMIDNDSPYDARGEAETLIQAREAGNRSGIERAYSEDIYRHYGGSGQDAPPTCKVVAQDSAGMNADSGYAYGTPTSPIKCVLDGGTNMYVTAMMK